MEQIDLDKISPAADQPRRTFDQGSLLELAMSIRERGVLEPIVVRPIGPDKYEIVMGERRWRASQMAGLTQIPAVVRDLSDEDASTDALVENFQREDLNPVERARAIKKLLESMPWEKCLKTLGVADSTMRRYLDLLDLPEPILTEMLTKPAAGEGEFLEGHALLLRSLNDNFKVQLRLAKKVKAEKLSIEDLKKIITAIVDHPDRTEAFLRVPPARYSRNPAQHRQAGAKEEALSAEISGVRVEGRSEGLLIGSGPAGRTHYPALVRDRDEPDAERHRRPCGADHKVQQSNAE